MIYHILSGVAAVLVLGGVASAGVISLAGPADPDSRISEFDLTGSFSQIDRGDGGPGDADGGYDVADGSGPFNGFAVDVFPKETAFDLGSLTFDDSGATGIGTEVFPVTAIDLGAFYDSASATTDVSGVGLELLYGPTFFQFGGLDSSDTITFVDGAITSVDLSIDASVLIGFGSATLTSFDGSFSITGDRFALAIDETEFNVPFVFGTAPQSRVAVDIRGRVAAIPAPGTAVLLSVAGAAGARRIRRTV